MSKRRNRHGRGQRGPVVLPRAHGGRIERIDPTKAEFFMTCLAEAVDQVQGSCPGILDDAVIGAEDVPTMPDWTQGRVPLSSAVDRQDDSPARVVMYRRPLELRATSRRGLAILVHRTLVEQLSALTGLPVEKIDPSIDE
ncbi:metallopeptidase family protein [Cutibacterium equinum]|uniref:Metallopeptidase family protein n=1 Tax=Cutibacterium equinum TaxID=3016342 RepID=A0ABY7QWE4_9ACTN|nr:metallopeptidase family protein [Cutibacterium equinum]WCC79388.1 metallopeptidase family protein [Cutibacterium equinum]